MSLAWIKPETVPICQVLQLSDEAGDPGVSLIRALSPLFQSQLAHAKKAHTALTLPSPTLTVF